jgi:proton-coupled amino acid transporter
MDSFGNLNLYIQDVVQFSPCIFVNGVGVEIYTFEGLDMVFPMEVVVDQKQKFGQIMGMSMFIISLTYGTFEILGYYAFGYETRDIITFNPKKNWLTNFSQHRFELRKRIILK